MDKSQLETLHKRIIDQEEYPGDVCPTEWNMTRFLLGECSTAEAKRMDEHLAACPDCRKAADDLRAAGAWFREHKARIFEGVAEKAARAGLEPWGSCPLPEALTCYATGAVPDTAAGKRFRAEVEKKCAESSVCREALQRVRDRIARQVSVEWQDLKRAGSEAAAVVRELLLALQTSAEVVGAPQVVRAMPGYRAQPSAAILALVLDSTGLMVLDDEGRPQTVRFELVRAEIDHDGHLVLDLSTGDRNFWERPGAAFRVAVCLQQENRRLVLPPERIRPDGRATIVARLVSGIAIRDLPIPALHATVIAPEETKTAEPQ